jgi:A/G-specific adenine glycosylase
MSLQDTAHMRNSDHTFFTEQLMHWHAFANKRSLPWKEERDPYKIWLSEIILQQTRAEQGLPYYLRFTETFPRIADMAAADDEVVFRLWQGLGYYNRCRNMLATARYISNELSGHFPDTYETIVALKGVGPYTAAAIASFAFGLPHAVVDGNVYRVLSRFFGDATPIDSGEGKKLFAQLADMLLDKKDSAGYNQAIMDLGATVCTPQQPRCDVCPVQARCVARREGLIALLPVKEKKLIVRNRYFNYLLLQQDDRLWIRKRTAKDIWQDLYEPFLLETETLVSPEVLTSLPAFRELGVQGALRFAGRKKQRLTHQLIETEFYLVQVSGQSPVLPPDGLWVPVDQLNRYAFPRTLTAFFNKEI